MRDKHPNEQLKIELLSQWKLEAESRNFFLIFHDLKLLVFIISTFEMSNVMKLWQKMKSAGKSYIPLYNMHWIAMFLDYTLSLLVGLSAHIFEDIHWVKALHA